jgi:hypothetical protein
MTSDTASAGGSNSRRSLCTATSVQPGHAELNVSAGLIGRRSKTQQ